MKKIFMAIALCLVCAMSFAQVTVREVESVGEIIASEPILSDVITHTLFKGSCGYALIISSTNPYEDTEAAIMLGKDKETAIASLNKLINLFSSSNKDNEYDINGYDVMGNGHILNTGRLAHTAGSYIIQPYFLKKFVKKLNKK